MRHVIHPHHFRGVFSDGHNIYTKNLVPGVKVYGEFLLKDPRDGIEYRRWDPRRSKLSAYIKKGGRIFPFEKKSTVLYLGASSGTTVSHVSDVCEMGQIFAIELSRLPFQGLLLLARGRSNINPIFSDAAFPERYSHSIGQASVIYQDISQRDQVGIFIKNLNLLASGGRGIIMVKARSVDVAREPREIYEETEGAFREAGLEILDRRELGPFEEDHAAIVVQKN